MAGYSGTPLARKLGIKSGARVVLLNAPDGFITQLDPLPPDVSFRYDARQTGDVIILFGTDAAALTKAVSAAMRVLPANGGLWIAWRKGASRISGALSEHAVRDAGLKAGLVDNKGCAIDETWSGLRFVVRTVDRGRWQVR